MEYQTIELNFKSHRILIAATVQDVTPDFLVTLRNSTGQQENEQEPQSILFVCHEHLASIAEGGADITAKGQALHYDVFGKFFEQQYNDLQLTKTESVVVKSYLHRKEKEQQFGKVNFFDYQDVLDVIHDGKISADEYKRLGYFFEIDITPLKTEKKMLERLDENHQLFDKLQNACQYNYYDQASSDEFTENDAKNIKKMFDGKERWDKYSFDKIMNFKDDLKNSKKTTFKPVSTLVVTNAQSYVRFNAETAAGKRVYNVLAVVQNPEEPVTLALEFNEKLKSEKLFVKDTECLVNYDLTGKTLKLDFNVTGDAKFEKISYNHESKSNTKYTFQILLLPANIPLMLFESIKTNFIIEINKKKKQSHLLINQTTDKLLFGNEKQTSVITPNEQHEEIVIDQDGVEIDLNNFESDDIELILKYDTIKIPIKLDTIDKKVRPLTGEQLWQLPKINQASFQVHKGSENKINKLIIDTTEYNVSLDQQPFFNYEYELVEHGYMSANLYQNKLQPSEYTQHPKLVAAYSQLCQCFKERDNIPSLTYWDDEIVGKAKYYLNTIKALIAEQNEDGYLAEESKNIREIGMIIAEETIYFTPLHPLTVAFQLESLNQLGEEEISRELLLRLTPTGLLPLFEYRQEMYKASIGTDLYQWMCYTKQQNQTMGETNKFLRSIVLNKIEQFTNHFAFLLEIDAEAALKINIVNITSDAELFKGILDYMMKQFRKKGSMPFVDVTIYQHDNNESYFEKFSYVTSINQVQEILKENFSFTHEVFAEKEVLRMIQQRLTYRKYTEIQEVPEYAHISFYKMNDEQEVVKDKMENQRTGYSLMGLLSGSTTDERENGHNYFGPGTKYVTPELSELITFTSYYNELVANLFQSSNQPYQKGISIMTNVKTESKDKWYQFLEKSLWMVFIEPEVEIEFFMNQPGVEVIHYSDQLTSTTKYDAITITNQIKQYRHLLGKYFQINDEVKIHNLLHSFNSLNGDWLLKLFGLSLENGRVKEKMSIISAAKIHTGYLNACSDIMWIPISLEEIIRVSGAIGLESSSEAAPFSIHNLGKKGKHSDDLLFIGLSIKNGQLHVYFHVCEVKLGKSDQSSKAHEQLVNTLNVLKELVVNNDNDFASKFYRNFFIQQALATYSKLEVYNLYQHKFTTEEWQTILTAINDQAYTTQFFTLPGIHLHFDTETVCRRQVRLDDISGFDAPIYMFKYYESDAETSLVETFSDIEQAMRQDFYQVPLEVEVLFNKQQTIEMAPLAPNVIADTTSGTIESNQNIHHDQSNEESDGTLIPNLEDKPSNLMGKNQRATTDPIEIGVFENSRMKARMGYLHPQLNNKHMLVIGKSGSGKTYYIQRMLDEISKRQISSVIIDYTNGFLPDQLDQEFLIRNEELLKQYIVITDKCPINPFKKYTRNINGLEIPDTPVQVGTRIKHIFHYASTSLGPQQLNDIYTIAKDGVQQVGDQFTMREFADRLKEQNMSAYTQFQAFFDSDLFSAQTINWDDIFDDSGRITIIQLAGYDKNIQKMLTEFLLWDLWHYATAKGSESHLLPVILDEAQNLDWSESGPSYKFLTEGRKFGVSAWFATQSYAQLSKMGTIIADNAATKVYFSISDTEIKEVAKRLKGSSLDDSIQKLYRLTKGKAIIDSLFIDQNDQKKQAVETVLIDKFSN